MRRLRLELGVLAALLASFLTVPLPLPHVAATTVWTALTAMHVARRRRLYAALLRPARSPAPPAPDRSRRVAATTALIACAAVVTVSGFAQWAGLAAATPWHAGTSTLLLGLAATHATRRLWRAATTHHIVAHRRELGTTDVSTPEEVGTVEFTTLTHPRRGTRAADCWGGYRWHEGCGGSG